jgi:hypothetical protein
MLMQMLFEMAVELYQVWRVFRQAKEAKPVIEGPKMMSQ